MKDMKDAKKKTVRNKEWRKQGEKHESEQTKERKNGKERKRNED